MNMDHLLALLPYRFFEETFKSILKSIEKSEIDFSIISKMEHFEFEKVPNIKNNIYIEDEKMILKDENILFDKLDALYERYPFNGIINFFEAYVEIAAKITERYGLIGNSVNTAFMTRNKYAMREALHKNNVKVPLFIKVHTFKEYEQAVKKVGFPCISKPVDGAASEGVVKITEESSLKDIYEHTIQNNSGSSIYNEKGILVEAYIDGPEISLEGIVSNEQLYIMGITAKTTEKEPYFNEIMHIHPAKLPEVTENQIHELAKETVKALEIRNGGIHLEVRIADDGIYVMECASRLGGDAIQSLVTLAKGYDPYFYVIQSGLNRPIELNATRNKYAGIRFIQSEIEGKINEAYFNEKELSKIPGIINKRIVNEIGKVVGRPPKCNTNRIGYVMAVGRESDEVIDALLKAEKTLIYTLEYQKNEQTIGC